MKKIFTLIAVAMMAITASADVITDARSWTFTASTGFGADGTYWAATGSDRVNYAKATTEEELLLADGTTKFSMTEGLYFTAAAGQLIFGNTGNKRLQTSNAQVMIPSCGVGDVITFNACSASSKKAAKITHSDGTEVMEETMSTSGKEYSYTVTTEGNQTFTIYGGGGARVTTITITPYVSGQCTEPIAAQTGIDPTTKNFIYTITEGESGETLTYSIDGADAQSITSGSTVIVPLGSKLTVYAEKGSDKAQTEVTAPSSYEKTETVASPATKTIDLVYNSFTLPANDNAGAGSGYALKCRSNQTFNEIANSFVINVNPGFVLTSVVIKGKNNVSTGNITLEKFLVDGTDIYNSDKFNLFNTAKDEQTITFTGAAAQCIQLCFGALEATDAYQFNADITVNWEFADAAPSATNEVTFAYKEIPTAISNVSAEAAAQKDGKFLENGKLVIRKAGKTYNAAGQLLK